MTHSLILWVHAFPLFPCCCVRSLFPVGYSAVVDPKDITQLRAALEGELPEAPRAGLAPEPEQIEALAASMPGATFEQVGGCRGGGAGEGEFGRSEELWGWT